MDDLGRPSFGLMQQRTGVGEGGRRIRRTRDDIPIAYYVFDLLYLDGYDLMQADLEQRKQLLASIVTPSDLLHYSDHWQGTGTALFNAAAQRGLEGIIAKRRNSCYLQKRSQRLAEGQDRQATGMCDRGIYRATRLAGKLRIDCAGPLR